MFTVFSNTRNSNPYLIIALAITIIVILSFAVAPSITVPKPVLSPVTGNQNAYVEFLRGEKAMYASPVELSAALSAYHLGEKAVYSNAADLGDALAAYHLGEKNLAANTGAALLEYRQGEKDAR